MCFAYSPLCFYTVESSKLSFSPINLVKYYPIVWKTAEGNDYGITEDIMQRKRIPLKNHQYVDKSAPFSTADTIRTIQKCLFSLSEKI